jgi:non-canonical (house-cleaning) NTP pyrophosphatase
MKTNFQPLTPPQPFNVSSRIIALAEARATNAYQDFSLDWSFGDHALQFTNEPIPEIPTRNLQ